MIKIENVQVWGLEAAVRGARNPKNSWDRSDSNYNEYGTYTLGNNDLKLLSTLSKAGTDHGKFLRMIHVQCDVTAPLYWWKEADQYKVGTTTDSTSTMHKIQAKEFTLDDFSHEHLDNDGMAVLSSIVDYLNYNRDIFNYEPNQKSPNRKDYWWHMIQMLPSSYNQKRTWDVNYAVLKNIYWARKDHKLDEWTEGLCPWIEALPYAKELILNKDA